MYPPPQHITQLTEFVLTYIYSLLTLFISFFFIYHKAKQNQTKTSILLSAEAVILWSLRLLVVCKVTKFKKRIWSECAAITLGSLLYFYLLSPCWSLQCDFFCGPWLGLIWWCLSTAVLEICQNFPHFLRSRNSAVKFAYGCQLARGFLALEWEDCFLFTALKKYSWTVFKLH